MKTLALFLLLLAAPLHAQSDVNTAAAFLAGVPPNDRSAAPLFATPAWRQHAASLNSVWSRYEQQTLNPMAQWSRAEIAPHLRGITTVRYLFSGPDILHALRLFPDASTYIMGGLEPVGAPPNLDGLSPAAANQALAETRKALEDILRFSFFITKDMKVDLKNATFPGTLPLISVFLARTGHHIDSVTYSELQKNGTLQRVSPGASADVLTVRFTGRGARATQKTLHYFSTNVANGSVSSSGFLNYLKAQPAGAAYLKAASYLLHESYFSTVRNHLLTNSLTIVQDDSGIPFKYFDQSSWTLAIYGSYTTPIDLFSNRRQPDLFTAYQHGPVNPLPFGTGYRWRQDDSNLLLAIRGSRPNSPPVVARRDPAPTPTTIPVVRPDIPPNIYPPARDGRVTLSLRLARTSPPPSPATVPGGRALVVFEYDVLSVNAGHYPHKKIRIAHGAVWGGKTTAAASRPISWTASLELAPLSRYSALQNIPTSDQLPPSRDLPLYTPALD
ncbi:MAG: hypothetical protein P8J87_10995 [Verrucomicrobiales bacterium]|nr:hypothetical protein [Verrucomicrobiales bacterium]